MPVVGYATMPVIPTFRGVSSAISAGISSPATSAGSAAGRNAGRGIVSGVTSAAKTAGKVAAGGLAIGFTAVAAGVGALAGTALKGGFARALNIQDAQKQLIGLGHSTAEVQTIMGNALASVKGTAFGLDAAAQVAASTVAAGIKPGEALTRTLKLTADAATIAKTPLNEMGSIINKVASDQKLSTIVLQQFSDRGVPLLQMVAKHYGVTAAAAQKMVTDGKVSFADFQASLEAGVGGAALASGETARGAFANVQAALSRIGAQFATPIVGAAPALFQAIAGATDRAGAALEPYAAQFASKLVPALTQATAWINKFDPGIVIRGIAGIFSTLKNGSAVGVAFDLAKLFGLDKAPVVEQVLIRIHDGIAQLFTGIKSGDAASIGSSLGTIISVARPLAPIFVALAQGVASISGQVGDVLSGAVRVAGPLLTVFATGLNFLANNTQILVPLIVAIVGAMILFRTAQAAANVAELGALPIHAANVASQLALAGANRALAAQMAIANGEQVASRLSMLPATAQVIIQTAAKAAGAVASGALAVATGVATAAQWLFNAALTANPIGIIIVAIVALVAGLILFFTKTELGRAIWANFVAFLGSAWEFIKTIFQVGIAFVVAVWKAYWAFLFAVAKGAFTLIIAGVSALFAFVKAVFVAGISVIRAVWSAGLNFLRSVASSIFNGISSVVRGAIAIVRTVIQTGLAIVKAIFTGNFGAIPGIVSGAVGKVLGIVGGMISGVKSALGGVATAFSDLKGKVLGALAGAANWLYDTGTNLIQGLINGIGAVAGNIMSAVTGPISDAISGAKSLLGIHSPSTVFAAIGRYVVQGFAKGIHGSKKQIDSAMQSMGNRIRDAFKSKAISYSAAISAQIAVKQGNKELDKLADRRSAIATKLAGAQKALDAAIKTRADYKANLLSNLTQFDPTATAGGPATIAALKTQLSQVQQFTTTLAKLRKAGLDDATYKSYAAAGPASLSAAQALLASGSGNIKTIGQLQGQLSKASNAFATTASNDLYGAGVNVAQGIVNGLSSQKKSIDGAMARIADSLVHRIKVKLGIHSPSTVAHSLGQFFTVGLTRGVTSGTRAVATAAGRLADATTKAFAPAVTTNPMTSALEQDNTHLARLVSGRLIIARRLASAQGRVGAAASIGGNAITTPRALSLPSGGPLSVLGSAPTTLDPALADTAALTRAAAALAAEMSARAATVDESTNFNGPVTVADPDEFVRKMNKKKRAARLSKPQSNRLG